MLSANKKHKIGSSALISDEKTKINILFSGYSEYLNEQAGIYCGHITYIPYVLDEIRREIVEFKVVKRAEPYRHLHGGCMARF